MSLRTIGDVVAVILAFSPLFSAQVPNPQLHGVGLVPLSEAELKEILTYCRQHQQTRRTRQSDSSPTQGANASISSSEDGVERNIEQPLNLESRVYGGQPAYVGQFSGAVSIGFTKRRGEQLDFKQYCGGTFITRRHIITAAHCIISDFNQSARLDIYAGGICNRGEKCTTVWHRLAPEKMWGVRAERVLWQSDYKVLKKRRNDIAIIQLRDAIDPDPSSFIYACLPPPARMSDDKVRVFATGWSFYKPPDGLDFTRDGPPKLSWKGQAGHDVSSVLRYGMRVVNPRANVSKSIKVAGVVISEPIWPDPVKTAIGDSGNGVYMVAPSPPYDLLGVHSGSVLRGSQITWYELEMDLRYRYVELCFYLNLCLPPFTRGSTSRPEYWPVEDVTTERLLINRLYLDRSLQNPQMP